MKRFEDTLPLKDYDNNPTLWFENEADFNVLWNSLSDYHRDRLSHVLTINDSMGYRLDVLKAEMRKIAEYARLARRRNRTTKRPSLMTSITNLFSALLGKGARYA